MRIAVCVKQTVDNEAAIALDASNHVIFQEQALVIDPYSEFAVEKAIQVKEAQGGEVVVVAVGGQNAQSALKHSLAMGADSATLVDWPACTEADPSMVAVVLAAAIRKVDADLVLGGCKAADTSNAQVVQRVATLLGIPLVSVVTALEVDVGVVRATRQIDDGVETVEITLPAAITAQQGLAEPRYPTVREIMQSKKKPCSVWTLEDLDVIDTLGMGAGGPRLKVVGRRLRPMRSGGRIIGGEVREAVEDLVDLLRTEAKVI
jgi:electron transfer flavoprotein beta subunit